MQEFFKGLFLEEEGQGMTEYGLILGLLVVAIVAAFVIFTPQLENLMTTIGEAVSGAANGTTTP